MGVINPNALQEDVLQGGTIKNNCRRHWAGNHRDGLVGTSDNGPAQACQKEQTAKQATPPEQEKPRQSRMAIENSQPSGARRSCPHESRCSSLMESGGLGR